MLLALRFLLLPFSWVYGIVIFLRHKGYDCGLLRSEKGEVPTVVIGNLNTGGTGKTPHAVYFMEELGKEKNVALLSRGYKRKTRGYIISRETDDSSIIGDEPRLIKNQFPEKTVAVCEDRLEGLKKLKKDVNPDLVILDDAYQHRRLKPDFSILLMSYSRPWWDDMLLPSGTLRDLKSRGKKADSIIVTKCPDDLTASQKSLFLSKINPSSEQEVHFTGLSYGNPVFIQGNQRELLPGEPVFAFAGIADTQSFKSYLENKYELLGFKKFADHHNFSLSDIESLIAQCGKFATAQPVMVTTEKDAVRLLGMSLPVHVSICYIPIRIDWKTDPEKLIGAIHKKLN